MFGYSVVIDDGDVSSGYVFVYVIGKGRGVFVVEIVF